MIDVLIHSVTALELILGGRTVAEHHRRRTSLVIENDITILVACDGGIGTADTRNLLRRVLTVLVDTLVAETVDTTERAVQLDARQVGTVRAVEVAVE